MAWRPFKRASGGQGPHPINSLRNKQGRGHYAVATEKREHLHFTLRELDARYGRWMATLSRLPIQVFTVDVVPYMRRPILHALIFLPFSHFFGFLLSNFFYFYIFKNHISKTFRDPPKIGTRPTCGSRPTVLETQV